MDTIIFKIDKKLKARAQKKCKEMGISLSYFLRAMTKDLVDETVEAKLIIKNIKHSRQIFL